MAQGEAHLPTGHSKVTMPQGGGGWCQPPPHQGLMGLCQQLAPASSAPQQLKSRVGPRG